MEAKDKKSPDICDKCGMAITPCLSSDLFVLLNEYRTLGNILMKTDDEPDFEGLGWILKRLNDDLRTMAWDIYPNG